MPLYYKPTLVQERQLQWGDVGEPHLVVLRRNGWLPTKSTIEIYLQVTFDIRNVHQELYPQPYHLALTEAYKQSNNIINLIIGTY